MEDKAETINAVASAIEKIGNSKWTSFLGFALGALVLYTLYENRAGIFTALATNTMMLMLFLGGGVLVAVGMIFHAMAGHVYSRYDDQLKDHRQQISTLTADNYKLHQDVVECRVECKNQIADALKRMEATLENIKDGHQRND